MFYNQPNQLTHQWGEIDADVWFIPPADRVDGGGDFTETLFAKSFLRVGRRLAVTAATCELFNKFGMGEN
jgi:hypothetical protein